MTNWLASLNIKRIIFLCFCLFSQTAFAGYWYGSFNVGGGVSSIGENNTLTLFTSSSPVVTNKYSVNSDYQAATLVGVGAGYRFDAMPKMEIALGASVSNATYATANGTVHPLVNIAPNFDVMDFSYSAESYLLLFEPTFIFPMENSWRVFLKPSLGVAWNKLFNYSESRIPESTTVPGPFPFRSHTQTSFAFAPSVGLEYPINTHARVQIAYEYLNAGDARLGTMQNQETNAHISAGDLSAHFVIVNILFA